MKRSILLCMLSVLLPAAHSQLNFDIPVYVGEASSLALAGGEVDAGSLRMSSLAYLDLTDAVLYARSVTHLRLYGDNRFAVDSIQHLYCLGGISDLFASAILTGALSERNTSYLTSTNHSTLIKSVTLSPAVAVETGLGFSLQGDKSQSQTLTLHFNPVYRQGKPSIDRVLALSEPTALRSAHVSLFDSRIQGAITKPHLYYSTYGLGNWKPADESHYTTGPTGHSNEPGTIVSGNMPQVAGITVFEEPTLFFPAALTPNGDGINDRFEIAGGKNYENSRLIVMTTTGQVVFDQSPYQNDFSGNGLAQGTYYYVYYTDKASKPVKKATLTLYR